MGVERPAAARRALLAGLGLLAAPAAQAQRRSPTPPAGQPAPPGAPPPTSELLRLVLPAAAGTRLDLFAQAFARPLMAQVPAGVLVDNRSGSDGSAAAETVAYGPANGASLLLANSSLISARYTGLTTVVDPLRELAPIALLAEEPLVLVVGETNGNRSLANLVSLARGLPGKVKLGSAEPLGALVVQQFAKLCGLAVVEVRHRTTIAVLEEVQDGTLTAAWVRPFTLANRTPPLRVLATSGRNRSPLFPEVPSVTELGDGEFDLVDWVGLFGPDGLTSGMVEALYGALERTFRDQPMRQAMLDLGFEPKLRPAATLHQRVRQDNELWSIAPRQPAVPPRPVLRKPGAM